MYFYDETVQSCEILCKYGFEQPQPAFDGEKIMGRWSKSISHLILL